MKQNVPIGPFSACFVGNTGQVTPLSQLTSIRTGGGALTENLPTEFLISVDGPVQSGNHTASVTLTFFDGSQEVIRLVKGLPADAEINSPIGQQQYALLLVGENPDGGDNYYLPQVRTEKTYTIVKTKNNPTTRAVVLTAEKREVTTQILYQNSLVCLASTMSGQYPY